MKKITTLLFFWWISFALAGQEYQDYYIRGVENMNQKKYNEAIEEFTSCIEKNLDFEKAYLNRGICLQLLSDTKNAIKDFNKVIKLNPASEIAFYNRGLARKEQADYKKAIRDFTLALQLNPNLKFAYYNRALVKLCLDDFHDACLDLAKAADMGVENAAEIYRYTCKKMP